jgi:hypothetical protein
VVQKARHRFLVPEISLPTPVDVDAVLGVLTRLDANELQTAAEKVRELSLGKEKLRTAEKTMKG